MLLDVFTENNVNYQRIWWTCQGLNTKTCCFPLDMPLNIFWTRRTMEQMRKNEIPLPNILQLPNQYHYLYPSVFNIKSAAEAMRGASRSNEKSVSCWQHDGISLVNVYFFLEKETAPYYLFRRRKRNYIEYTSEF